MSRIARAIKSSDLSHRHHDREPGLVDCDVIRSLGLTAINRSLGVLILECKEACAGDSFHDAARVRDLIAAVFKAVRSQERRDKVRVNTRAVAEMMVKETILDRCSRCQGRGFLPLAYGPDAKSDARGADCPSCLGSGRARRDFDGRVRASGHADYNDALKRFWEAVEGRLVEAEAAAKREQRRRFSERY